MHSLRSEALALLFSMPLQLIFLYNYTLPLIIHIMIRHHLHVTRSCHFLSEIRMTSNNIQYAEVCTGGWTKSECKIKSTLLKPWETYSQIYCAQICSWALPPLHLPRVHSCPHHQAFIVFCLSSTSMDSTTCKLMKNNRIGPAMKLVFLNLYSFLYWSRGF